MKSCSYPLALVFAIATLIFTACKSPEKEAESMKAPIAPKVNKELIAHGEVRVDPWYWLNQREDTNVINYLKAENAYTEDMLKPTGNMIDQLYEEIIGRIEQSDESVPYELNGYLYYHRYEEGAEYPIYLRKEKDSKLPEEILLHVPEMAEGYAYYHITGLSVSPDNRYLAFGVDTVSRRQYIIHIKDLETGEVFEDRIENTTGYAAWAGDNATLFYTVKDDALRPFQVWRHTLGQQKDVLVFQEDDATFNAYAYSSKSRKYIMIHSASTMSDEFRILAANDPEGKFKIFQPRERGHEYNIDHAGDYFYIRTNWKSKNFRLMRSLTDKTQKESWEEVIPARDDFFLQGMEVFKDFLVLDERKDGLVNFRIVPWDGSEPHYLEFWEETYYATIGENYEFDTDVLRFRYSSLTTPFSTYDYDLNTRELDLKKRQKVLGEFNPEDYHAERRYYPSEDGTMVPVSMVYRKDIFDTASPMPAILYGYGSYGYSLDPYFSSARLSLLNRGFIFAIAHIRGGQEMGRNWYEEGKLLKKKNTFIDFIACGEGLINDGYTSPEHLYAIGGSAGGLLVGAVVNMRPDLFNGIVAQVPFVDVVTTMLDESIPLTTGEYDEWGNPADKQYYDYMLSYSPYDNVEAKDYPAMLVTTGLHDSQVQYWEPAKWVAKLRDMKTDDNLLLLHTDMETGHGGASGRFSAYKDVARYYTFLLYMEGITL